MRRACFAWLARTTANSPGIVSGGLLSSTDCQVSAPASGMTVNVSTGEMFIPGTEGGSQGAAYARITSQTNEVISTASGANPRIDTICATWSDTGYTEPSGGSGSQWALQVVTGTPTTGATLANLSGAATLPGSSLLLGYVLVPTSATSIVTADILNVATVVTAAFAPPPGAWVPLTLVSGVLSSGTPYYAARARIERDIVRLAGQVQNNSGGTVNQFASVPTGMVPASGSILPALIEGASGTTFPLNVLSTGAMQGAPWGSSHGVVSLVNGTIIQLDGLSYPLV